MTLLVLYIFQGIQLRTIKNLWPILIVLCCSLTARGTEVVMLVYEGHIILASDSAYSGKRLDRLCKIQHTGSFFWAAAGLVKNGDSGYDINKIVAKVAKDRYYVREVLDMAGGELIPALQKELIWMRTAAPDHYRKTIEGGTMLSLYAVQDLGGV